MRTSLIASALTTLLFTLSAINAAPVADAEAEALVEVIIERDADVPEHDLQKRQVIVTVTRTAFAPRVQFGGRTRTITRTIYRSRTTPPAAPTPPVVIVPATPNAAAVTPDSTPTQQAPKNTPQVQPASVPVAASDSGAPNADAQAALDSHNKYRALHQVGALTWDDTLASYAASHASSCVFEHTGGRALIFLPSNSLGPYGENLAAGYGSVSASIDAWYNEINQYSFSNGGFSVCTHPFYDLIISLPPVTLLKSFGKDLRNSAAHGSHVTQPAHLDNTSCVNTLLQGTS